MTAEHGEYRDPVALDLTMVVMEESNDIYQVQVPGRDTLYLSLLVRNGIPDLEAVHSSPFGAFMPTLEWEEACERFGTARMAALRDDARQEVRAPSQNGQKKRKKPYGGVRRTVEEPRKGSGAWFPSCG